MSEAFFNFRKLEVFLGSPPSSMKVPAIVLQARGGQKRERLRDVCSLVEAALRNENIETQYDDQKDGFVIEGSSSFMSTDGPPVTSQRMFNIAKAALQAVKRRVDAGEDLDKVLDEAAQGFPEGFGSSNERGRDDDCEMGDEKEPTRPQARRGIQPRAAVSAPAAPRPLTQDQLEKLVFNRIEKINPAASQAIVVQAAHTLAAAIFTLGARNWDPEDTDPASAFQHVRGLTQKAIAAVATDEQNKKPGFINWQASELQATMRAAFVDGLGAALES